MQGSKRDSLRRNLRALAPAGAGVYFGRVITVDPEKHVVDVVPEMQESQVWTDVPYQPLTGKVEGEWLDPDVGAAVVILQDALGRRRVIGPPEYFTEWHLVSASARVRVDLRRNQFTIVVDGGASVEINGTEVTVDNATKITANSGEVLIDKVTLVQVNSGEVHFDKATLIQVNGGTEPAMRGDTFQAWYTTVKAWADTHVHAGPSGPPVAPAPDFDGEILNPTVKLD